MADGRVAKAVTLRQRRHPMAGLGVIVTWGVYPARKVGKGARTQIGPNHLNREQAFKWAQKNGYLPLGYQEKS